MTSLSIHIILTSIICLLTILDISSTTKISNKVEDYEQNGVVSYLWERFGKKRIQNIYLIFLPIVYIIILTLFFIYDGSSAYFFFIGFMMGNYLLLNIIHMNTFNALREQE